MKVESHGNYFWVWDPPNISMFLNWRQKRGDDKYIVEDNLVNRIVLGLPYNVRANEKTTLPDTTELRPYQVTDVKKMLSVQHILNANPMGLGKTPETISYLKALKAKTALIVTPKIIRQQWVDQIEKWWGCTATIFENQKTITPGI